MSRSKKKPYWVTKRSPKVVKRQEVKQATKKIIKEVLAKEE